MFVYQRVGEGIATYCRISLFLSFPRWVCYQGGHLLQREMFTRRQGLAWEMDGFFPDHPIWSSHTSIWFILWCGSSTDPSFRSVILGTRWTFIIWHHGISWDIMGYHGILWDIMGYHGWGARNLSGSFGGNPTRIISRKKQNQLIHPTGNLAGGYRGFLIPRNQSTDINH